MNIAIGPKTQELLEERLKSGEYGSADDVVYAALEALNELNAHKLDEETLDAIDQAEDQIERGEVHNWSEIRERVRSNLLGH